LLFRKYLDLDSLRYGSHLDHDVAALAPQVFHLQKYLIPDFPRYDNHLDRDVAALAPQVFLLQKYLILNSPHYDNHLGHDANESTIAHFFLNVTPDAFPHLTHDQTLKISFDLFARRVSLAPKSFESHLQESNDVNPLTDLVNHLTSDGELIIAKLPIRESQVHRHQTSSVLPLAPRVVNA